MEMNGTIIVQSLKGKDEGTKMRELCMWWGRGAETATTGRRLKVDVADFVTGSVFRCPPPGFEGQRTEWGSALRISQWHSQPELQGLCSGGSSAKHSAQNRAMQTPVQGWVSRLLKKVGRGPWRKENVGGASSSRALRPADCSVTFFHWDVFCIFDSKAHKKAYCRKSSSIII